MACLGPDCPRTIVFRSAGERMCDDCRRKVEAICRSHGRAFVQAERGDLFGDE